MRESLVNRQIRVIQRDSVWDRAKKPSSHPDSSGAVPGMKEELSRGGFSGNQKDPEEGRSSLGAKMDQSNDLPSVKMAQSDDNSEPAHSDNPADRNGSDDTPVSDISFSLLKMSNENDLPSEAIVAPSVKMTQSDDLPSVKMTQSDDNSEPAHSDNPADRNDLDDTATPVKSSSSIKMIPSDDLLGIQMIPSDELLGIIWMPSNNS